MLHLPNTSGELRGFKLSPGFTSPCGQPAERNGCTVPPMLPAPATKTSTLTHPTQQAETRLPCLSPGWIPWSQLCRRMLCAGCWGCSGGAASGLQGRLGHRETHHFCRPLSTGDPKNLTLCNGWVTVELLRGRMGWYARSELIGEYSTGDVRSTACMDHELRCREAAGLKAERSHAGGFPLARAAVHCASAEATWEVADLIPAKAVAGKHQWWRAPKRKEALETHQTQQLTHHACPGSAATSARLARLHGASSNQRHS